MRLVQTESWSFDVRNFLDRKERDIKGMWIIIREWDELTEQELEFITANTNRSNNLQEHEASHFVDIAWNGFVILYEGEKIVGHIMAHDYTFRWSKVLERWSLWIDHSLREKGIGKYLMCKLNEQIQDSSVVSVTKIHTVIRVNNLIMPYRVNSVEGDFRNMLEEWWPLSAEYQYYINWVLKDLLEI